jgi:hypothetical protein
MWLLLAAALAAPLKVEVLADPVPPRAASARAQVRPPAVPVDPATVVVDDTRDDAWDAVREAPPRQAWRALGTPPRVWFAHDADALYARVEGLRGSLTLEVDPAGALVRWHRVVLRDATATVEVCTLPEGTGSRGAPIRWSAVPCTPSQATVAGGDCTWEIALPWTVLGAPSSRMRLGVLHTGPRSTGALYSTNGRRKPFPASGTRVDLGKRPGRVTVEVSAGRWYPEITRTPVTSWRWERWHLGTLVDEGTLSTDDPPVLPAAPERTKIVLRADDGHAIPTGFVLMPSEPEVAMRLVTPAFTDHVDLAFTSTGPGRVTLTIPGTDHTAEVDLPSGSGRLRIWAPDGLPVLTLERENGDRFVAVRVRG